MLLSFASLLLVPKKVAKYKDHKLCEEKRLQHLGKGADELESRFVAEKFESLSMRVCKDMCGARQGEGKRKGERKREKKKRRNKKTQLSEASPASCPPIQRVLICSTVKRSSCMRGPHARKHSIYARKERHYKDR
jgi:hypothetical protein